MRKTVLAMMMTGVMAISGVLPCAVWASEEPAPEEGLSILKDLLGEDSPLNEYIPEDIDVDGLVSSVTEQLGDENSELRQGLDAAADMLTDEDGTLHLEMIGSLAGMLLGGDAGDDLSIEEDTRELDPEETFAMLHDEVIKECLAARYTETMEAGDALIVSPAYAKTRLLEDGTALVLGQFTIMNYTAEGADLKLQDGSSETKLLTLRPDAEGNYEVTDVETSEDGEDYTASVEAMCAETEIAPEDFFNMIGMSDLCVISNTVDSLEEHPEYEHIEYMAEMVTRDELYAKVDDLVTALFSVGDVPVAEEPALEEPAAEETAE